MELVLPLSLRLERNLTQAKTAQEMFSTAKNHVAIHRIEEFKAASCRIQEARVKLQSMGGEAFFTDEYVWCCYVSGFSAKAVTQNFTRLKVAHDIETELSAFIPADLSGCSTELILERVYRVWKNKMKANAVIKTRGLVKSLGWSRFKETYLVSMDGICQLPMMGPALSCHLARNLGFENVVKPDVHLKRLAERYHFESVQALCEACCPESVVNADLILWLACVDLGSK